MAYMLTRLRNKWIRMCLTLASWDLVWTTASALWVSITLRKCRFVEEKKLKVLQLISQKRWFLWITLWLRLQEKLHSFQIAMEAPNKDPYIDHITETTALISLLRLSVLDTTLTLALCLSQLAVPTLKK